MRDLLSKLDALVSETALRDKADLEAKRQALQDLQMDPVASKDPEIKQAIMQRKADLEKEAESKGFTDEDIYQIGDDFGISFSEDFEIATEIVDILEDGVLIDLDETAINYLTQNGFTFEEIQLDEEKQKGVDGKACWKGYRRMGTKQKGGKTVDNCVKVGEGKFPFAGAAVGHKEGPEGQWRNKGPKKDKPAKAGDLVGGGESIDNDVEEAKYQGREVPLGKPMAGDVKKSKVYVRGPKGNVVKVNFGDKKMKIKKSNPKRRKSFRARHNCKNPGPRWKARYWSCRAW